MVESRTNLQKPALLTFVAVTTLISGGVNLFWGFVLSSTVLGSLLGIICIPITILPSILGILEIILAARLLSTQLRSAQPSVPIAIFEILCFVYGNVFSMVVGILALVFYNDLAVKSYFVSLNNYPEVGESIYFKPDPTPALKPITEFPTLQDERQQPPVQPITPGIKDSGKRKPDFPRKVARK